MSPGMARRCPRSRLRGAQLACLLAAALLPACGHEDTLDEARALRQAGRAAEAVDLLQPLVDEDPANPELLFLYGAALTQAGDLSRAYFPLRRAMEDPEWLVPAGLTLASGAIATSNPDSAVVTLGEVLEADPDNVEALVARTNAYVLTRRNYEEALADSDRVLELAPDDLRVLSYRVVALLGLGRVDEAGDALSILEQRYAAEGLEVGDTSRYCAARGVFETEKGDRAAADRVLSACLEKFPTSTSVVDTAIQFYEETGQLERSLAVLRQAYESSGRQRAFRVPLAVRLHAAGMTEEAEELLREPTRSDDPDVASVAWIDLAGYLIDQQQRYEEGLDAFEQAIAVLDQPTPQLLFQYADALLVGERYDEAQAVAERISVPTYRDLVVGRVLLARHQPRQALDHFAAALSEWPNHGVARYYAARAAEASGQIDRAIEEYRYSIRADPGGTDARERLARLYVAEGDPNRALTVLYHDVAHNPGSDESVLIELEILARLRQGQAIPERLHERLRSPEIWGRAVAAMAAGTRAREGSAAALAIVEEAERIDLAAPENAPALASLVQDLIALDRASEAVDRVAAIAAAHPEVAAFHALRGDALAAAQAPAERTRAAYARALELEAENARALAGMGRLAVAAGDSAAAVDWLERAWAAAPDDGATGRLLARQLAARGDAEAATAVLQDLLGRQPTDAAAVLELARIRHAAGAESAELQKLLRWATRFGAGAEARALRQQIASETAPAG